MKVRFLSWFFLLAVVLMAANTPTNTFDRLLAAGLSEIPIDQWPSFIPGEAILTSPRLEAKYGDSELRLDEFGRMPIAIRHVEKIRGGQYRLVWDSFQFSPVFLAKVRWQLEGERIDAMRRALAAWGELRPVGLAVGEDLPTVPNDPMADRQAQHQLLRTLEFQKELVKRSNRRLWTVAVMDSGARQDRDCPPLDPRSKTFVEGSAGEGDQAVDKDRASHGTRVSEIIAGVWNNNFGGYGVANVREIMMLKVLFAFQVGGDYKAVGSEADMIRAGEYLKGALRPDEKAVVNISWSLLAAFWGFEDIMRSMEDRVLFVTSAGNIGQDANPQPQFPCVFEMPNNACTTGVELDGSLRNAAKRGSEVRLAALGGGVVTSFGSGNGTSYAVPQVVGVAAELGGESANLKPSDLLKFMRSGGVPIPGDSFGIMRLDPLGALAKIRVAFPIPQPPPPSPPQPPHPPDPHSHPPHPTHHFRMGR